MIIVVKAIEDFFLTAGLPVQCKFIIRQQQRSNAATSKFVEKVTSDVFGLCVTVNISSSHKSITKTSSRLDRLA